jgi:hypothetical protein
MIHLREGDLSRILVICVDPQLDFFLGTLAPFLRASERPMAIACFLLFTVPPFPPFPDFKVPLFLRRIALRTDFCADLPYLAITFSLILRKS